MKIAVLTMTFNNNYGGMLQSYALMEYLKKLGHSPELLYVQRENKPLTSLMSIIKQILKKYLLSYLSKRWAHAKEKKHIEKNIKYFIDTYITPKTDSIYNDEDFNKIVKQDYDAYIVGSDQVWRPRMYRFMHYAFFDFVKSEDAVLLSYAASFGVDSWEIEEGETLRYKEQIKRFNAVSIREDSGVKLCKTYLDCDAEHVLDPTLLLTVDDYRQIIKREKEKQSDGKLLSYILDSNNEKQILVDTVSRELDMQPFIINVKSTDRESSIEDRTYPTVTSWLKGFDDAEYVVTDSFHGCVFSILFNKPFIVYGNEKRGMARFDSILKMFELEDRLIYSKDDITVKRIQSHINWDSVNEKLEIFRNRSSRYLVQNLTRNINL